MIAVIIFGLEEGTLSVEVNELLLVPLAIVVVAMVVGTLDIWNSELGYVEL